MILIFDVAIIVINYASLPCLQPLLPSEGNDPLHPSIDCTCHHVLREREKVKEEEGRVFTLILESALCTWISFATINYLYQSITVLPDSTPVHIHGNITYHLPISVVL